jgi:F420H(2)-dependent quinone reductase
MVGTMPVLLLTTTGRKTEKKRTVPVMYLHEDPNYVITAPNKGRDKPPPKRLNLQSSPQAIIELGDGTRLVMAEQASSEEKRRLWAQLVEKAPAFDGYQKRTRREIPMIILCTK